MNISLLHKVYPTTQKYNALENLLITTKPILDEILFNIIHNTTSSEKINSINIDHLYNSDNQREYDLNNLNHALKMKKHINNAGIYDYNDLISMFTPVKIITEIVKKFTNKSEIEFNYKTNKVKFYFFNTNSINVMDILIKAIKAFTFIEILGFTNQNIKINYSPVKYKKSLPKYDIIGVNSVNSGFTTFAMDPYISIFREEESDKVLIHELVHYLKLDFVSRDNTFIHNKILSEVNIEDIEYINFFETYTESIGVIFNSIFNCILTKTNINNYFDMELKYMEDTVLNLLEHSNISKIDHLFKKGEYNVLKQKTSILSYYILKYGLLLNSDLLINKYFPKYKWFNVDVLRLYNMSKKSLLKKGITHNKINNDKSMRMTYNELKY